MTDDQRLHWQIAGAIFTHVTNGMYGDREAAMQRAVKDAEMLRIMVVGDWKAGELKPDGTPNRIAVPHGMLSEEQLARLLAAHSVEPSFCPACKATHKPGMPCEGRQ